MPIVGVRIESPTVARSGLGKKVNQTTRARNIASDTSLIISFRDSSPVHTKTASNIASDIYRCSGEGVAALIALYI